MTSHSGWVWRLRRFGGMSHGHRSATAKRFLRLGLLFIVSITATAEPQSCLPYDTPHDLKFNTTSSPSVLLAGLHCDVWTLTRKVVDEECGSGGYGSYLLFEFWRMNGTSVETRSLSNVYFIVARGTPPAVVVYQTTNRPSYSPPRSGLPPYTGVNGSLIDAAAVDFARPYHRILVPVNATATGAGQSGFMDWFATVAFMDSTSTLKLNYTIRVSCVREDAVPCPEPLFGAGPCSGNGKCDTMPDWTQAQQPLLNKVCYCDTDWGDYGCQTRVRSLDLSSGTALDSALVAPQSWSYWQVSVPLQNPSTAPDALLVELSRTMVGPGGQDFGAVSSAAWGFGGDPLLLVMPKGVNDSNRLPNGGDLKFYSDVQSYLLEQNLHYVMYRGLPKTFPGSPSGAGKRTAEFYIAVYNNENIGRDPRANVTLRVRVRGDTSQRSALCPGDCSGRGACWDPKDTATFDKLPPPVLAYPTSGASPDFLCACQPGFGGVMCEGGITNMSVTTSGDGRSGGLQPGQWTFFVLNIDSRRFDYRSNDVSINWVVSDKSGEPPSEFKNAFLILDMQTFPRARLNDGSDPTKLSPKVYYASLTQTSNNPQPLLLRGTDMKQGFVYVLSMYNSDYLRQRALDYSLAVVVPSSPRTWLHPYMSVVLGVTASIIICLLLTLCRRLVQRFGWGPFRSAASDNLVEGQGPNGARGPGGHGRAPPRGVPGHIIDTFYSYEYTASKAEKQQLSRSCRDHEQQQQQQVAAVSLPPGTVESTDSIAANTAATATPPPPPPAAAGAMVWSAAAPPARPPDGVVVEVQNPSLAVAPAAATAATAGSAPAAAAPGRPASATPTARATVVSDPLGVSGGAAASPVEGTPAVGGGGGASQPMSPMSGASTTGPVVGEEADEEPQCTVCLCEYEEGERITRLPCKHEFHGTCITKWLQTHYTCPICRISLLPDEPEGDGEGGPGGEGGAQQDGSGAGVAAGGGFMAAAGGVAAPATQQQPQGTQITVMPAGTGAAAVAAAQPPPPPQPRRRRGFLAWVFGDGQRRGAEAAPVRTGSGRGAQGQGVAPNQMMPLTPVTPAPATGGPGPARGTPAGGVSESLARSADLQVLGGAGASSSATQVIARGPSASLEPPAPAMAGGGGSAAFMSGGGGGSGNRSPVSPTRRLASGRVAALPAAWAVPPGADVEAAPVAASPPRSTSMGGWTGAPVAAGGPGGGASASGQGPRDTAVLPQPSDVIMESTGSVVQQQQQQGRPSPSRPGTAQAGSGPASRVPPGTQHR